jgi:hypothetical protein
MSQKQEKFIVLSSFKSVVPLLILVRLYLSFNFFSLVNKNYPL